MEIINGKDKVKPLIKTLVAKLKFRFQGPGMIAKFKGKTNCRVQEQD